MKRTPKLQPAVARFLAEADDLTLEQWTAVYWRYVETPRVDRGARTIFNVTTRASLEARRGMPIEKMGRRNPVLDERNRRIDELVQPLPEIELDAERGGSLKHRASWLVVNTCNALTNVELLSADPATLKSVRNFLGVFGESITFPEYG